MLVENLMTQDVLSVAPEATLSEAIATMLRHKISGMPVIDAGGELVGIVSEGDFLRRIELGTEETPSAWSRLFRHGNLARSYALAHGRKVEEVMSRAPVTVEKKTSLADAVGLMQYHAVRRLPVVEGNEVVGILSRSDIMQTLGEALQASGVEAGLSDTEIVSRIQAELDRQAWAPQWAIAVTCEDGHVELRGTITDEKQRLAARVVAENVTSVKSVTDTLTFADPMALVAF